MKVHEKMEEWEEKKHGSYFTTPFNRIEIP